MNDKEIRLRCIEIAKDKNPNSSIEEILKIAKELMAFVDLTLPSTNQQL